MDSFTNTITKKAEDVVLPPTNEDGSGGSSGSCVVCKEDTTLPPMNEDGSGGSSGSCVIARDGMGVEIILIPKSENCTHEDN
ncbi:hypothetical protein K438DRAFT_1969911 [Mycena galopus ATCC 62051]|nr:hypothetical protein K438DRAFT_1969911 [Mycena galopus ATCC 62051]